MTGPRVASTRRGIDERLVAPGPSGLLVAVHRLLAAAMAFRLVERPWWTMADRPAALFEPVWIVSWLPGPPPGWLVLAVQVLGVAGGVAALTRRAPRVGFVAAWLSLVFVAACWGSSGKVMHNEVLLVTVAFPLLFSAVPHRHDPPSVGVRWGWGPRAAATALATVYFATGIQKIRHSGLAWVSADNLAWVLRQGRSPFGSDVNYAFARQSWLMFGFAAAALTFELSAPLLMWFRRTRIVVPLVSFSLHTSIWFFVGLNYSSWVLTSVAVAVPFSMRWDDEASALRWYQRIVLPWSPTLGPTAASPRTPEPAGAAGHTGAAAPD